MSALSSRPLLPTFLPCVNALLSTLALPFTIDHPTDLTPSLFLAIFESLISARLPIPGSVRQSRTRDAKARAMLVLLGVLECDVLRGGTSTDSEHSLAASNVDDSAMGGAGGVSVDGWVDEIGLGEVDPERLADGGWDETIFVGELLCWLARRKGILPRTRSSHRSSHPRSLYSNHHSYGTEEGEHEGDTADFSTSLLLRPSPAQKSRSSRPPSPSPSVDDANPDSSAFSHITDVPRHPLVYSPEPSLSASATTGTDLSIHARSVSSRTSVSNTYDDPSELEEASQDTLQMYEPRQWMQDAEEDDDRPPTFRPRCIHELEDPSYIRALARPSLSFEQSASREHDLGDEDQSSRDKNDDADEQDNDDPYAPSTPTPQRVRLSGWINTIDAATELSQFVTSRSHPRSRAVNTSASFGPGSPSQSRSQLQSRVHARTSELPKPSPRLKADLSHRPRPVPGKPHTPHCPSPSPSPSPPSSSKYLPACSSPSPPPSPPAHSDPPFDVSFSSLNNTSTPAKLRPLRRPQSEATTTTPGPGRPYRRDRTPSYTPSPPSFSTPDSLRSAGPSGTSGTRSGSTGSSSSKTRLGSSATPTPPTTTTKKTSPSPTSVKGMSPPPVSPPGSTATTNTLLTERARLLTELAALKRARAASNSGSGVGSGSPGHGSVGGGGSGVVGRRVGVGVRS
ncbi:hypothetical protein V8E55_011644 [Tylopilus felleus]